MTEALHSKYSASRSHRWIECTASIDMEAAIEEKTSPYAELGIKAHDLAAKALEKQKPVGYSKGITKDLKAHIQAYVDEVNSKFKSLSHAQIWVENRIEYGNIAPGGFGTSDAIVIGFDEKELELQVHIYDLKFGEGVLVKAEDNMQLALYAEGILNDPLFNDWKSAEKSAIMVYMHIFQPRMDNHGIWKRSVKQLHKFTAKAKRAALQIENGETSFNPSHDICRWCKASFKCEERIKKLTDWVDLDSGTMSDEDISEVLRKKKHIIQMLTDLEDYAFSQAQTEKGFPGWKIVHGRSFNRWKDDAEVFLKEALGARRFQARKLITITDAIKLLGKDQIKDHIHKPDGKPTLALESDPREPVDLELTFENLEVEK